MNPEQRLKVEHKLNISNTKVSKAIDGFNKIQEQTYNEYVLFYDKLALMSAGVISISVAFLPKLKEQNGEIVNQYSWLFILGIGAFTICALLGLGYRLFIAKLNWHASKGNMAKRTHENASTVGDAIKKGVAIDVSDYAEGFDGYVKHFKEYQEAEEKTAKYYSLITKIIKSAAPVCFVVGTIAVSVYILIQIFDF